MKKTFFVLTIILNFLSISAQSEKHHTYYTSSEINLGNYVGIDIGLNYAYKEAYILKIGYSGNIRIPNSQPDDYTSGLVGALTLGLNNPYDQMQNYLMTLGKITRINSKNTIRLNLSAGIGYTIIKEPENWTKLDTDTLGENYSFNYRDYNTISLIINPKIEFPFTKIYGVSLSPMIQINKDRTYFGIGIGQMIGLLKN